MTATRHILFPFDFSAQGRVVAPYVRTMAQALGARVTLFSVAPPVWALPPDEMRPIVGGDSSDDRNALQIHLGEALVAELTGVTMDRVADRGDPALRIAAYAQTHGVDLIMMPTHGLGTFRAFLVGSVTSKVLHDATCPVWTAAHAETQATPVAPKKVLCAVDLAPQTSALMQYAAGLCADLGASLSLMHVVGSVTDWPSLASERAMQEQFRETSRQRVAEVQRAAGVDAPLLVASGDVVDTITEQARREKADLIVIGRGAMTEPFGRLRTHAYGIIERSPCPVLSV